MTLSPPVALRPEHRTDDFDCGQPALNDWLRRYALQNQRADAARTFVVCASNNRIAAFYERLDFEASPLDPLQLMLLLKDARRTLNAVQR